MDLSDLEMLDGYVTYKDKQRLVQFPLALRDQFE